MKAFRGGGTACVDAVCSLVRPDILLRWLDSIVNVFLDDITKEIIKKYEANLQRAFRE